MQMIRCAAVLLACLTGCSALCGCAAGTSGEDSGSGLWLGIEPAKEDEFGKVTYADGIYLSQTVQEPVPDPYADDTEEKDTGVTDDGLRYTLYQRHAEITGHSDSFELEELDIPAEIGGLPVTRITDVALNEGSVFDLDRNGAFYSCYTLRRVNVPEGVRHILIVDDTFTTGSTLAACYSALRECVSGEVRISVATLAFVKNN